MLAAAGTVVARHRRASELDNGSREGRRSQNLDSLTG